MVVMGYMEGQDSLGLEAVGIVRRVGSGPHHQDFREGDRVSILGGGMLQTVAVVKSLYCTRIPLTSCLEDAATIPCVYSTVIHSLLDIGGLAKRQVS
jgi:NADPH:quinone reductase-like Zn-dependent oxidoreductase